MPKSSIAIIGSGIVGVTIAHHLSQQGYHADIYEKGHIYPYPANDMWQRLYASYQPEGDAITDVLPTLPSDLKRLTQSGFPARVEPSRMMWTGGSATLWEAITPRLTPQDFRTKSVYGYGDDWAIDYDVLEPYYGLAEQFIGVSGTTNDNPFLPYRTTPYPMPVFELDYYDHVLADKLAKNNILLHTTPQARNSIPFDNRAGCVNYGTCRFCPIQVRYDPNIHLKRLVESGFCTLYTNITVRRIIPDRIGKGATIVYRDNDSGDDNEAHYQIVIVACGAIETARLLLLSKSEQYPDGLGNTSGWVGKNLAFHHAWRGQLYYDYDVFGGRIGPWTGQSDQFVNADTRGKHGSIKIEFSSRIGATPAIQWGNLTNKDELKDKLSVVKRFRPIAILAEVVPTPQRYIALSEEVDRFGDPFAHIHYELSEFDVSTYEFGHEIYKRFAQATDSTGGFFNPFDVWDTGAHHLGTARMSQSIGDGVVNSFGQLHDAPYVFALGGSMFVGSGGAMNPTLTMVALAIRSSEYIIDQILKA